MFLDVNELKGLIVDLDSFDPSTDSQWVEVNKIYKCLVYSCSLERLQWLYKNFIKTYYVEAMFPLQIGKELGLILNASGLNSYEVAFVSADRGHLSIITGKFPIGTISIGNLSKVNYNDTSTLPDYIFGNISEILDIYDEKLFGYFAEGISAFYGTKRLGGAGRIILTQQEVNGRTLVIYSGGRYFNTHHCYNIAHPLSQRVIWNKNIGSQWKVFLEVFRGLLHCLRHNVQKVDAILSVPPRPESIDRFKTIVDTLAYEVKLECLNGFIKCKSGSSSQKYLNAQERQEAVKGKFLLNQSYVRDITGKSIVLIDDVIATGSTALECANILYENGAAKVYLLVLGINQREYLWRQQKYLRCTRCDGAIMKMRCNNSKLSIFFGCETFRTSKCKENYDFINGFYQFNINDRYKFGYGFDFEEDFIF